MRRFLSVCVLLTIWAFAGAATASAASLKSCPDVNSKINGKNYKLGTKVKVKGITCSDAKMVIVAYSTGAGMLANATLEALKNRCRDDKNQAAAKKANRIAVTCASPNGKRVLKAFLMGG